MTADERRGLKRLIDREVRRRVPEPDGYGFRGPRGLDEVPAERVRARGRTAPEGASGRARSRRPDYVGAVRL